MNNKDGFTIIELMIGAAIVGIMAAVVFQAVTGNSYKQQCMDSGGWPIICYLHIANILVVSSK